MVQEEGYNGAGGQPLGDRLKALVERGARYCDAAYCLLLVCDQETSELACAAGEGREGVPEKVVPVIRWVLSNGEAVYLHTEQDAKRITGCVLDQDSLPLICVPVVKSATDEGVLIVRCAPWSEGEFKRWQLFFESLGELAGMDLENAALHGDLRRREEQVRDLVRSTLDAQEAERERICLEVHDGVTQTLASAFQHLQALEDTSLEGTQARQFLLRASALVKQAIQESREVINSLLPATLRDLGLVVTLRQEMRQLEQEMRWRVEFEADAVKLPADIETGLYRIIHEAITNARKHADTRRLRVAIATGDDRLRVEVRDWGIGFNYDARDVSRQRGTGLLSMRKRAELLRGVCTIESSPGRGTAVHVEIPLSHSRNEHG